MFFSSCQKTSMHNATSSDLRSVESSGGGETEKRRRGCTLLDITFRQRHLNRRCHKSISHANAYRDLRDAMRSYARKYLRNSQNNGMPYESNKFIPLGRTIQRTGAGPWISHPFINFRCTQSSFISRTLSWASLHSLNASRCAGKIAWFLDPAQAIFLICCLDTNEIRTNRQW